MSHSAARLSSDDRLAQATVAAIQAGEPVQLRTLLRQHPDLVGARIVDGNGSARTLLHTATDWPGFFPRGPEVVTLLIEAGGDPNAPALVDWLRELGATKAAKRNSD